MHVKTQKKTYKLYWPRRETSHLGLPKIQNTLKSFKNKQGHITIISTMEPTDLNSVSLQRLPIVDLHNFFLALMKASTLSTQPQDCKSARTPPASLKASNLIQGKRYNSETKTKCISSLYIQPPYKSSFIVTWGIILHNISTRTEDHFILV